MTGAADHRLLLDLLPRVSRTFALGIRLLPADLSDAVSTAYLLCRIADTIEDDASQPAEARQALLLEFRGWLDGQAHDPTPLVRQFAATSGDDAALVRVTGVVLGEFARLPEAVRAAIRPPVEEMCRGMAGYVARSTAAGTPPQPADIADLEQYCWYVAGTVGWMLTDLFQQADGRWSADRYRQLRELSRHFGLGLQLTNVIRDMGEDHRRGVTFVPAELSHRVGCDPHQLFAPGREQETAEVLATLVARARQHLDGALAYCTTLPHRSFRVRLFCLVPLFLAAATLRKIGAEGAYRDGWVRLKLTRARVRVMVVVAAVVAPSNALIRAVYRRLNPVPA